MEPKMEQVVAFVTGGASGLGKAIVDRILKNGGRVAIVDKNNEGEKLAATLGEGVIFFNADVTSETDVEAALKDTKKQFGKINVLINCAGIAEYMVPYDFGIKKPHSLELYKRMMDVNALGTFNVTRLAVGMMVENIPDNNHQRGVIINIASIMSDDGSADLVAYSASKGAVLGMMLPFARAFADKGIRVVTISPGYIATPMAGPDKEFFINKYNLFPKRRGSPEEVAHLMETIIENNYINAVNLKINGGYHGGST